MNSSKNQTSSCALCDIAIGSNPIVDELLCFCCHGCHAVYKILESKNALGGYQNHPIFEQAIRAGIISNPDLLEQIKSKKALHPEEESEKIHLEILEMWCPSCAEVIKLFLLQEKGIKSCIVDYSTDLASIEFSPRYISKERIFSLIKGLGYDPRKLEEYNNQAVSQSLYLRFIIAAFCALNAMMFSYPIYASYFDQENMGYSNLFSWLSLGAAIPVITYSAYPIYRRFIHSLLIGFLGMESLVVIGTSAAFSLSLYDLMQGGNHVYFDTLTVIIAFVLLGKIIEAKAKLSTKSTLIRLNQSIPKKGRKVFPDGRQAFTHLKEIDVGDVLCAFSGEKIVLDGIVEEGSGLCDESHMTGEAWPVAKKKGDMVLSGAIVAQGRLEYRVSRNFKETALHKIIEMVEMEIDHKTAYVRAADTIIKWFVPLVLVIASLTMGYTLFFNGEIDFPRAMAVLLISCPCAIGIAAPLAEAYMMGRLATMGVIIRNRGCLALLGMETVIVLDKTGTVTTGLFHVVEGLKDLPIKLKVILRGLSSQSSHPISLAIANAISENPVLFKDVEEYPGKGIKGIFEQKEYLLGSASFLQLNGVKVLEESALTSVYFSEDKMCVAKISLADQIREEIPLLIKSLSGCQTVLLSGDSTPPVREIAQKAGIDIWKAGCNPFEKKEFIEVLRKKGEIVCMIGDGINDAPALTSAHIGISVMNAKDISIQVSDILLTTEKLSIVPAMRELAKRGRRVVKQNLFWAFFYNVIGIGLAAAGLLNPIFAAFAMVTSSLIVLFNAQRLKH